MNKLEMVNWLNSGGRIYFSGNENMGTMFKSKLTKMYCYEFNAKVIESYKAFKPLFEKVTVLNEKYGLTMNPVN